MEHAAHRHLPLRLRDADADRTQWALDKLRVELVEMRRLSEERGFSRYIVLVAPQSVYVDAARTPGDDNHAASSRTHLYRMLREILADQPGYIDGYFRNMAPLAALNELFDSGQRDPIPVGGRHFDEDGYQALGQRVAARLAADGVFDRQNSR